MDELQELDGELRRQAALPELPLRARRLCTFSMTRRRGLHVGTKSSAGRRPHHQEMASQ